MQYLRVSKRDPCPAEECDKGFDLYSVSAWKYSDLLKTYAK